jgi:hypothetical protein
MSRSLENLGDKPYDEYYQPSDQTTDMDYWRNLINSCGFTLSESDFKAFMGSNAIDRRNKLVGRIHHLESKGDEISLEERVALQEMKSERTQLESVYPYLNAVCEANTAAMSAFRNNTP